MWMKTLWANARVKHVVIAALFLLGGVGVILYAGPGRAFVRGSLGDVLVVPFLVHILGVAVPKWSAWRIGLVAVIAIGTELLQMLKLVRPTDPAWAHLIFGSTFDPWDLLGYAVGVGVAVLTARIVG